METYIATNEEEVRQALLTYLDLIETAIRDMNMETPFMTEEEKKKAFDLMGESRELTASEKELIEKNTNRLNGKLRPQYFSKIFSSLTEVVEKLIPDNIQNPFLSQRKTELVNEIDKKMRDVKMKRMKYDRKMRSVERGAAHFDEQGVRSFIPSVQQKKGQKMRNAFEEEGSEGKGIRPQDVYDAEHYVKECVIELEKYQLLSPVAVRKKLHDIFALIDDQERSREEKKVS